jgi:hypothetical protein
MDIATLVQHFTTVFLSLKKTFCYFRGCEAVGLFLGYLENCLEITVTLIRFCNVEVDDGGRDSVNTYCWVLRVPSGDLHFALLMKL